MPLLKPILTATDLPPPGPTTRSAEAHWVDFKSGYKKDAFAEMAKDMAAFANALGGAILIGTTEDDASLDYPGMSREFAETLSVSFADAQAKHMSPSPPIVERAIFPAPAPKKDGFVMLAVNVQPFAEQIVGARVDSKWRFPVRVGADTNYLEPAMLPLYTSAVRRNTILLHQIDWSKDVVKICMRHPRNQSSAAPAYLTATIHAVDVTKNRLMITLENESTTFLRVPLDDVDCVWECGEIGQKTEWVVRLLGYFEDAGARRQYQSNPRNTIIRT